jgi:hypothetical protein
MGLVVNSYAFGGYDSDAQAFFTAAGITDTAHKNAINTFVVGLKAASLWTPMKALYLGFLGSAAKCKFNLKDPRDLDAAFRLGFSGGWTYASIGMAANGTNGFADTYFNPSTGWSANSGSVFLYSQTSAATGYDMAATGPTDNNNVWLQARYSGDWFYGMIGNNDFTERVSNTNGQGFYIANRNSSTNTNGFKNGSEVFDISEGSTYPNTTIYVGAAHRQSYGALYYSNREMSLNGICQGLTDQNATDLSTLANAMMTTLGINVY